MILPDLLQIGEIGNHCGLLAAEGQIDEIFNVRQTQFAGHGLELVVLTYAEAFQPFGQVVQLIHVDILSHQPVENGIGAGNLDHPAVLCQRVP